MRHHGGHMLDSTYGYAGKPLSTKLGITESQTILAIHAPHDYQALLGSVSLSLTFATAPGPSVDVAHVFVTKREDLAKQLATLRKKLKPDAALWISWPKKASKVPTTVTEDVIRELALPLGWVDIKVCAVTEVWSGLKLVVRKELR